MSCAAAVRGSKEKVTGILFEQLAAASKYCSAAGRQRNADVV